MAFMSGKLRIKGDMTLAIKLEKLMGRMNKAKLWSPTHWLSQTYFLFVTTYIALMMLIITINKTHLDNKLSAL